ncbi:MAG: ABC transporter ATP-binding protein [Candidatus Caldarchaeum sp.]|nr:ABC transporter ATP-binding protein [Candidatus Caldarchaeum sp.]
MRTILEVKNVVTGYGKLEILRGVTMQMYAEETTAILGPNGAGKSTLLKVIAGLLPKWSGKVYYDDKDITNLTTKQILSMGLTYVMQGRNVFPYMTVYENLEISGLMIKDKEVFRERLGRVYEIFPVLREKRSLKAHTLSGGEQRMLELAKALIYNPKLLLLDEPSVGLSPKVMNELYGKILSLVKSEGVTLILVEQNVSKALEVADRVFLLDLGEVKFSGTPEQILSSRSLITAYLGI